MMPYLSPFAAFDLKIQAQGQLDPQCQQRLETEIQELRRQSNRNPNVQLRTGLRLNIDQVEQLWNEIQNPLTLDFHLRILEDKRLLHFLEYGHPALLNERPQFWQELSNDFQNFLLPYLQYQIREAWHEADQKQDGSSMEQLLPLLHLVPQLNIQAPSDPLNPHWAETSANLPEEHPVVQGIFRIRQLASQDNLSYLSERELISHLSNQDIKTYNQAQEAQSARNQLGREILHLVRILIEEHGRRDGADAMLRQLNKLELDETIRQDTQTLKQQYAIGTGIPIWLKAGLIALLALFVLKYLETQFFS